MGPRKCSNIHPRITWVGAASSYFARVAGPAKQAGSPVLTHPNFSPILYVVLRLAQGVKSEGAYGAAPDYVRRPLRAPQSRPIYESCHFPRCGLRQTCFRVVETEVSVLRPIGPGLVTAPIRPRRFVSRVLSTSCLVRKVAPREVCRGGALVPRSGSGCALGAYFPEHGLFEIITLGS